MKRNKAGKLIAIMTLNMCLLLGCAEAPQTEEKNGIAYETEQQDEAIQDMIKNETTESGVKDGEHCKKTIGSGNNVINIDAVVSAPEQNTVAVKTAEPDPEALNTDVCMEILMGGKDNLKEIAVDDSGEGMTDDNGEIVAIQRFIGTPNTKEWSSIDGNLHLSTWNVGFDFVNDQLNTQYESIGLNGGSYTQKMDGDIAEDYTKEMAKKEVQDVFSQILKLDIEFISCDAVWDDTGAGYYDFTIVPVVDNLPLAVNDRTIDVDEIVDVNGSIRIGKDGIASISAENFLWKITDTDEDSEYISLDSLWDILQEYMDRGDITGSPNVTFSRLSLSWLPITDDWETAELRPVWKIYLPALDDGIGQAMSDSAASDICINAMNGKIESLMQ